MFGTSHSMGGPPAIARPLGLPVSVILLRRDGVRISGEEFKAAVPLVGLLIVRPTDKFQNGGGGTHMADLIKPGVTHQGSVCKPLFNPTVEKADARGFVLSGYEIDVRDGQPVHVEQVWLVRPLAAPASP